MVEKSPGMLVITTLPDRAGTQARVVTSLDIAVQHESLHRVASTSDLVAVVESWWEA
jgi:hypothetical protein